MAPTPGAIAGAVARRLDELEIDSAHIAGNSLGAWIGLARLPGRGRSLPCAQRDSGALRSCGKVASARGQRHRIGRRLRPLLMLSRRARRPALAHVVADPDRVPRAAARRMVSSHARAPAYEATNTAMFASHFTGVERTRVPLTVAFGERDRMIRPVG